MLDGHENTDSNELVTHLKALTTALTAVHGDLYCLHARPRTEDKPAAPVADLNVTLFTELKNVDDAEGSCSFNTLKPRLK